LIREHAFPCGRDEKKIDALIVGYPVHDAHHREVCGVQGNAHLLVCLPNGSLGHALSSVEMASDYTVIPIFIPSIGTPEEQYPVLTEQE
jgi:hypothetical protein